MSSPSPPGAGFVTKKRQVVGRPETQTVEVRWRGEKMTCACQTDLLARIGSGERGLVDPMEAPPSVEPGDGIGGRLCLTRRACQATRKQPLGCSWAEIGSRVFMPAPQTIFPRRAPSGQALFEALPLFVRSLPSRSSSGTFGRHAPPCDGAGDRTAGRSTPTPEDQ